VHLSLVNTDPHRPAEVACALSGPLGARAHGRILTAPAMNAHNTFDHPDVVMPADFTAFSRDEKKLTVALPAKSIITLTFS
jgi:alpha-N-arabinofuranosidase